MAQKASKGRIRQDYAVEEGQKDWNDRGCDGLRRTEGHVPELCTQRRNFPVSPIHNHEDHALFQCAYNNNTTVGVHSLKTGLPRHAQRAVAPSRNVLTALLHPEIAEQTLSPGGWLSRSRCMPKALAHQIASHGNRVQFRS